MTIMRGQQVMGSNLHLWLLERSMLQSAACVLLFPVLFWSNHISSFWLCHIPLFFLCPFLSRFSFDLFVSHSLSCSVLRSAALHRFLLQAQTENTYKCDFLLPKYIKLHQYFSWGGWRACINTDTVRGFLFLYWKVTWEENLYKSNSSCNSWTSEQHIVNLLTQFIELHQLLKWSSVHLAFYPIQHAHAPALANNMWKIYMNDIQHSTGQSYEALH